MAPVGLKAVNNQRGDVAMGCMTLNPAWTWVLSLQHVTEVNGEDLEALWGGESPSVD